MTCTDLMGHDHLIEALFVASGTYGEVHRIATT
jgi:hypothetical protein